MDLYRFRSGGLHSRDKEGFYRLGTVKRAHDGSFVLLLKSTDQLLFFIKINNVVRTYRRLRKISKV